MSRAAKKTGLPLATQIVIGMLLGMLAGLSLGKGAAPLGELGKYVIQLIKAAAAPLLFAAIVNAVLKTEIDLRSGGRMILIATTNACVALLIGLSISNLFKPGSHLDLGDLTKLKPVAGSAFAGSAVSSGGIEWTKSLASFVPSSLVQPFAENMIITLVVMALFIGFGLRRVRSEQLARGEQGFRVVEEGAAAVLRLLEVVLGWIIRLTPAAVFGVVAKSVGEYGFAPLKGLGAYVGAGLFGLALHIVVTYHAWLILYAGMSLRKFWSHAREPVIYSIGSNSSLATLPMTLKALDNLGVSKSSATLGACVGTNLNNDGIILYEAMAVLFVAQAHGLDLSLGRQVLAALSCLVAAVGIAGVPEAGFISLALVLATVGLPQEILPLLLTVDWVLARARSVVNVLSDMLVSIILDGRPQNTGRAVELPAVSAYQP